MGDAEDESLATELRKMLVSACAAQFDDRLQRYANAVSVLSIRVVCYIFIFPHFASQSRNEKYMDSVKLVRLSVPVRRMRDQSYFSAHN